MKTQAQVNALKATGRPYTREAGNGLRVRVAIDGGKTFQYRYRWQGRQETLSLGSISLRDAQTLAAEARVSLARGYDPKETQRRKHEKSVSLREFLDETYEPHIRAKQRRPNDTLAVLKKEFHSWLDRPMNQINLRKAQQWRDRRINEGLAPASANKYTNHLKALTAYAELIGTLEADPLQKFRRVKVNQRPRIRWLNQDEENALLKALHHRDHELWNPDQLAWEELTDIADRLIEAGRDAEATAILQRREEEFFFGDHLKPIVTLTLNCGLRRQEALQLRWDSIMQGPDGRTELFITPESDKTARGRFIPLNIEDQALLNHWRGFQEKLGIHSEWCFTNPTTGKPYKEIKSSWKSLIASASKGCPSLSGVTIRTLRATFGSKLVQRGIHMLQVSQLMGHSSVEITERHYAALADHGAREAMDTLSILGNSQAIRGKSP